MAQREPLGNRFYIQERGLLLERVIILKLNLILWLVISNIMR